ncbi:solute carrier family 28 member 3-like [Aplysia californica]|uniref:Solute carrier family 28 member 3-like n=1 Tax=Aplysia californica TaxID=6500 RepID=A0ABM0JIC8_APLCA|nr:solute carrier family 28 member 3-like [Aplysia californica]
MEVPNYKDVNADSQQPPREEDHVTDKDTELRLEPLLVVDSPDTDHYVTDDSGCCVRGVAAVEQWVGVTYTKHRRDILFVLRSVLLLVYLMYFAYCMKVRFGDEGSYILVGVTVGLAIYIASAFCDKWKCFQMFTSVCSGLLYAVSTLALVIYLGVDIITKHHRNAQAILGIATIVFICFLFSHSPSKVNWHPVFWGLIIQFVFASLVLRTEVGYSAFKWMGNVVNTVVNLSDRGSKFVLGASFETKGAGFFFSTAGVIVFFNAMIFVLDYVGVLEFIVLRIGGALAFCLGTGPVESVVSAANIFIGLSEAPLLVRPYLHSVTRSELHAIMTCGFASISGAFMAMFIQAGAPASHLLTAAVISAPAALAVSKLVCPETREVDLDSQRNVRMRDENSDQKNVVHACSDGASFSIKLVASIMVNMMAFVSAMNLVDHLLVWLGERAGIENLTFGYLCSYVMYPVSYSMGVEPADCGAVGALMGVKLFATPFVAYVDLGKLIHNRRVLEEHVFTNNGTWHWTGSDVILDDSNTTLVGGFMSERSEVIITYAMCGLSAFPAIGFCMGTLIPMCPRRKPDIVDLVISAFVAGNVANIMTAAIAGVMFSDTAIPLPH